MSYLYLIRNHLDKDLYYCNTRHEAVGKIEQWHDANDYRIVPVRTFTWLFNESRWQGPLPSERR